VASPNAARFVRAFDRESDLFVRVHGRETRSKKFCAQPETRETRLSRVRQVAPRGEKIQIARNLETITMSDKLKTIPAEPLPVHIEAVPTNPEMQKRWREILEAAEPGCLEAPGTEQDK
jgi:hypothetical protein